MGLKKKESNETWVSLHFRWGDVRTSNTSRPNLRTGLGLGGFCKCMQTIEQLAPQASVFFFAEGLKDLSECKDDLPNVQLFNESNEWKRDLDIMSQSQLLIGGSSRYAHLYQLVALKPFLLPKCFLVAL